MSASATQGGHNNPLREIDDNFVFIITVTACTAVQAQHSKSQQPK